MEEAKKFVESMIESKPVVVFSMTQCPFCKRVRKLLEDDVKVPAEKMEILEIEDRPDRDNLRAYFKEKTGATSVPRVFIQGKFIGGCDDTFRLHASGELKKLLDAVLN